MSDLNQMKKVCSFYVSDVHLVTMMIPYLSKQLNKGNKFIVLTQKNLEKEVEMLLGKINIKEEEKEKIRNIDWRSSSCFDDKYIKEKMKTQKKDTYIIINGENNYINKMNEKIEKIFLNIKIKNITIINCYEVMQFNQDMNEILDKHDKILNTSGEKEIEEVFQGYKRKMA